MTGERADEPVAAVTDPDAVAATIAEWEALGERIPVGEHRVWCARIPAATDVGRPPLLVLHGFPTCSFDYRPVLPALAAERDKSGRCPELFMQVNTGEEPQKAGVLPAETEALIAYARKLELPLVGLMCIPPVEDDVAPHFAFLAKLAKENGLSELSMGMSGDFEMAIRFGATHVRVGSAIFGARSGKV